MSTLIKSDYDRMWWPLTPSQQGVSGDAAAHGELGRFSHSAIALCASPNPTSFDDYVLRVTALRGDDLFIARVKVHYRGELVHSEAITYVTSESIVVDVVRTGGVFSVTLMGSSETSWTGGESAEPVWMVGTIYETDGAIYNASLSGTPLPGTDGASARLPAPLIFASEEGTAGANATFWAFDGDAGDVETVLPADVSHAVLPAFTSRSVLDPVARMPDFATVVDLWTVLEFPLAPMVGNVTVSATLSPADTAAAQLLEQLVVSALLSSTSALPASLFSSLGVGGHVGPPPPVAAWVVNYATGASSQYEGFDFNSLSAWGDTYLGVRPDGVYVLEGDTDAGEPIRAQVGFGVDAFGGAYKKNVESAYLGVSASGPMHMRVTADGQTYTYEADRVASNMQTQRVRFGRGLRASHIALELLNEAGANFELADIQLLVTTLSRRV